MEITINKGAKLPQIAIVPDKWYQSQLVRVFFRALRMGSIAAVALAIADPAYLTNLLALVTAGNMADAQVLVIPLIVAFFAAVEKTWRDASEGKKKK